MAGFWSAYANINDDIRHRVVEEGWFGKKVTPDIDVKDMPALQSEVQSNQINNFYGQQVDVRAMGNFYGGPGPSASPDFYGPATQVETPAIEAPEISAPAQPPREQEL